MSYDGDNRPFSDRYRDAADDWCDKDAAARMLEECKTAFLEKRKNDLDPDLPDSHRERIVKASEEWRDYIVKLVRAALLKASDTEEVGRLAREHSTWIKQLPEVTRTFFEDLIKSRKAYFAPPTPEEVAAAEGSEETVWEDAEAGS